MKLRLHSSQRGGAILLSLLFAAVLIAVTAGAFVVVQNRFRVVHQAAAWEESLLAAEAGVDFAMNGIRKTLYDATSTPFSASDGWSTSSGEPYTDLNGNNVYDPGEPYSDTNGNGQRDEAGSYFLTNKEILPRSGEGGSVSQAWVTVDEVYPTSDPDAWYRIRALGITSVPGGAVVAGEEADLKLRRFSLRFDARSRENVNAAGSLGPQARRYIEAVAKPIGAFSRALFGVKTIDMTDHNIVVDSYDSRDPNKSTNGFYPDPSDPNFETKRQWNGDIATNGTVINAGSAHIYGTASTQGGSVLNADNVTGHRGDAETRLRDDFYQDVLPIQRPNVSPDAGTPSTVTSGVTITAQAGTPRQYQFSQIKLAGSDVLRITGAANGSTTYAQIVVTGDISMAGQAQLVLDPGVNLRIFVIGDADMTGGGVVNPNSPLNLQVYGVDRPKNADGTPASLGSFKIAGNGGFRGAVYAPNYNITMKGGGNSDSIYGSFVGNSVTMTGIQSFHYDEALGDGGLISDYRIVSWFEENR